MPDTLVEEKIERALQDVLKSAATGLEDSAIVLGHDTAVREENFIVCSCLGATEDPQAPGNWTVRARVGVYGNPDAQAEEDTPLAAHNSVAGIVSDKLMDSTIGSLLSAAVTGLHVYDPLIARRKVPDIEGRHWVKWTELDLYALCVDP